MKEVVKEINPDAEFHFHGYVHKISLVKRPEEEKKYDIVYFAKITKSKGIEDLLEAICLIRKIKPNVKALLIGSSGAQYLEYLKQYALNLGITENIEWAGFLPTQHDVHKLASEAKVSVLPTHYDMIPGTIIESLFLKLPVVAYNTGSIHEVNKDEDIISLVEKFDIEGLAYEIHQLLINDNERIQKAEKGYRTATEMFDNIIVRTDIIKAYQSVMEDFKQRNEA